MPAYYIIAEIPEQYIVDEEFIEEVFADAFIDGVYVERVGEVQDG